MNGSCSYAQDKISLVNNASEMQCSEDDDDMRSSSFSRISPPKVVIDSSPLQSAMDKNKESLKVKLLVRRSFNQLVEQGIMPSLKTSPAIYEQQRQLERAKTGDILKAKIKKRPARAELLERHILEQSDNNVDPSLAEKKRLLEKALLVDHLNSKISHRPGPLDLIGKNILHADEPIERIVKEGLVDYASTLKDSNSSDVPSVDSVIGVGEEDSLSSEGESLHSNSTNATTATIAATSISSYNPGNDGNSSANNNNNNNIQPLCITALPFISSDTQYNISFGVSGGAILAKVQPAIPLSSAQVTTDAVLTAEPIVVQQLPTDTIIAASTSLKLALPSVTATPVPSPAPSIASSSSRDTYKEKAKKKSKTKLITKARSIKFHEYKGPSNAQKTSSQCKITENNYQLNVQQKYLLEYLEEMCSKPAKASANVDDATGEQEVDRQESSAAKSPPSVASTALVVSQSPDIATEALNKLKVFQLKKYCKQYNLPVSGPKSSLIERLKPFMQTLDTGGGGGGGGGGGSFVADIPIKVEQSGSSSSLAILFNGSVVSELDPSVAAPETATVINVGSTTNNSDESSLQKRIAELQQELMKSQQELEQMKSFCSNNFGNIQSTIYPVLDDAPEDNKAGIVESVEDQFDMFESLEEVANQHHLVTSTSTTVGVPDSEMSNHDGYIAMHGTTNAVEHETSELHQQQHHIHHSETHDTLDKVLAQVQPAVSKLTEQSVNHDQQPGVVGDMPDSSISMINNQIEKQLNFDGVATDNASGGTTLQDMIGVYNDIDLVDFQLHMDSSCDATFPLMTDDDEHHQLRQSMFGSGISRTHPTATVTSHEANDSQHDFSVFEPHQFLNNNDLVGCGLDDVIDHTLLDTSMDAKEDDHLIDSDAIKTSDSNNNNSAVASSSSSSTALASSLTTTSVGMSSNAFAFHAPQQQQHPHNDHHSNVVAKSSAIGIAPMDDTMEDIGNCSNTFKPSPSETDGGTGVQRYAPSPGANNVLNFSTMFDKQTDEFKVYPRIRMKGTELVIDNCGSPPAQQQQQHQHDNHQHQHHHLSVSTAPPVTLDYHNNTSQDHVMDFETLLCNAVEEAGMLTNSGHRIILDCSQDKPMYNYLPDSSILDYLNEECSLQHDYEIKNSEY